MNPSEIQAGENPRTQMSAKDLNEKVMQMLLARPSCADSRSVMLELIPEATEGYNWQIGHFDPGRGDRYTCKMALRRIHESLRDRYEMIGED